MLDIIIPHYREKWEIGEPLFRMISLQRGINFDDIHVILVNDGEEGAISQEWIDSQRFPYKTDVLTIPHGGVSAARNAGMDHATNEWITFCDFDDSYSNVYSLRDVLSILPAPNYDLLWSKMIVEDFTFAESDQELLFISPERTNYVFTHGKFYRKSFLVENDIRFDTSQTFNEDSLFNALILAILDYHRIGQIKSYAPLYIWKRRANSVTSSEGSVDPATWGHFTRNWKVCEFYKTKNLPKVRINDMVVRTVYDTYYMLNSTGITSGMREKISKAFSEHLSGNVKYWQRPEEDVLEKIRWLAKYELAGPGCNIPDDFDTVGQWMKSYIKEES